MTEAEVEAEARKQEEKALQQGIQMQMNLHTVTINVQDLGLTVDTDDAAREALAYGRQGNLVHRYRQQQELKGDGHTLRLGYSVDPEKVKTALEEKCVPYNEESVDSQLVKKEVEASRSSAVLREVRSMWRPPWRRCRSTFPMSGTVWKTAVWSW